LQYDLRAAQWHRAGEAAVGSLALQRQSIRPDQHVVEHVGPQHGGQRVDYLDDLDFAPLGDPVLQFRNASGDLNMP